MPVLKVLTVSSETGGARNLAEVVEAFQLSVSFTNLCAKSAINVFKEKHFPYRDIDNVHDINDFSDLVRSIAPDAILSGRGIQLASPERTAVLIARNLKIPSVGVIDEWYDYRANFADELGVTTWPDVVCCPDGQAKYEAIVEGLPRNILKITGSPALSSLYDKREKYKRSPPKRLNKLTENSIRPIIVFISEIISDGLITDYSQRKNSSNLIGYDENIVRSDILEALSEVFKSCTVLEKPHPRAAYKETKAISDQNINWQVTMGQDLHSLCWWGDIVIGMRSMGLFEAAILGKATISYQPNLKGKNRCTAVRKELIPCCRSMDSLKTWLKQYPQTQSDLFVGRPDYAHKGAATAVYTILKEISISFANA